MLPQDHFHDLIRRVRAGDEDASAQLASMFEPFILRYIRFAMRKRRDFNQLRARLGSSDICQSVFKSFFVGVKQGRFDLNRPDQLEKLLRVMSRFKIATEARKLSVILREVLDVDAPDDRVDPGPGPEKPVDDQDLAEDIIKYFSEDELDLLVRRLDEQSWSQIATALGGTPDALRKRLERAVERVKHIPSLQVILQG